MRPTSAHAAVRRGGIAFRSCREQRADLPKRMCAQRFCQKYRQRPPPSRAVRSSTISARSGCQLWNGLRHIRRENGARSSRLHETIGLRAPLEPPGAVTGRQIIPAEELFAAVSVTAQGAPIASAQLLSGQAEPVDNERGRCVDRRQLGRKTRQCFGRGAGLHDAFDDEAGVGEGIDHRHQRPPPKNAESPPRHPCSMCR